MGLKVLHNDVDKRFRRDATNEAYPARHDIALLEGKHCIDHALYVGIAADAWVPSAAFE